MFYFFEKKSLTHELFVATYDFFLSVRPTPPPLKMDKYFMCLFDVSEHSKHFYFHFSPFLFLVIFLGGRRGMVTVNYELKYRGLNIK